MEISSTIADAKRRQDARCERRDSVAANVSLVMRYARMVAGFNSIKTGKGMLGQSRVGCVPSGALAGCVSDVATFAIIRLGRVVS
jgi:hypothetical protein